ncbi:hypothetical protein E0W60_10910 [Cupriavidus oxalaticus]|uniref:Uncharacterized protein n=1 Tax=Cupriavidus oxalaticus TaxID=96344 RepID=A0A4P7L7T8_9BURK|nr:hypothetical protein E0W60_10910 [Cupriavidus oxalaticus]
MRTNLFTTESVSACFCEKFEDRVSYAILDAFLARMPEARVGGTKECSTPK